MKDEDVKDTVVRNSTKLENLEYWISKLDKKFDTIVFKTVFSIGGVNILSLFAAYFLLKGG